MKTPQQILLDAADIVAKGWAQHQLAKNSMGERVPLSHPRACKFCMLGAIQKAAAHSTFPIPIRLLAAAIHTEFPRMDIVDFKDASTRTQAEVVAMFRKAAE